MYRSHVLVCGGTGCTSSGSEQIIQTLKDELKKNKLQNEVAVVKTGCHGLCAEGPVMIVYPEAVFYSRVRPEDVEEIVSEHLLKGRIVERLVYHEAQTPEGIKSLNEKAYSISPTMTLRLSLLVFHTQSPLRYSPAPTF